MYTASAAARIRRLDENAEILIFERSGYISYANCGLPYYIGGTIQEEADLTLQTPERFWSRFRIQVKVRHEVTAIHPKEKAVTVQDLATGKIFEESYDRLVLSPGAKPIRPRLPGIDSKAIFTLRTVEDTLRISSYARTQHCRSAVVVGGGFIGVEMAENLQQLGMNVTLVEKQTQLLGQLDTDMASFVHAHMKAKGVTLLLGRSVAGFEEKDGGISVKLEDSAPISADIVVLAIGVTPDSTLAADAGLRLGVKNSIAVDAHMQTSDPHIYAVGDAAEIPNMATGVKSLISLAGPANKQGRIAADNICGIRSTYKGSTGSSVLKVFEITVASTGMNERAASAAGLDYEKLIISPASHASYYPGGRSMTIKLLFEKPTEKILGVQIVGFDGVDKRSDVIATAMQAGLPVTALKDLDLAYAPPYSSAKDPVNMAGFAAENLLHGLVKQFHYKDLISLPRDGSVTLLDIRTDTEFQKGYAEGFTTHIPVDDLRERLAELDKAKPIYVMCQSGLRSYIACRILSQNGFDCYNFSGGYRLYESVKNDQFDENCSTSCGQPM